MKSFFGTNDALLLSVVPEAIPWGETEPPNKRNRLSHPLASDASEP
jgi:hypothetical protein